MDGRLGIVYGVLCIFFFFYSTARKNVFRGVLITDREERSTIKNGTRINARKVYTPLLLLNLPT
ncbi:hypothetical protein C2G38_2096985 [Gigaspora rosea]|uniref:Uncharacterized protein n=1 Tax=Gigaspora rosea TaxID=44941 RepID=A0A397UV55_9GLOM|nr:hypothetical protein C2G38_2096985 [Gigaspora rosea]